MKNLLAKLKNFDWRDLKNEFFVYFALFCIIAILCNWIGWMFYVLCVVIAVAVIYTVIGIVYAFIINPIRAYRDKKKGL